MAVSKRETIAWIAANCAVNEEGDPMKDTLTDIAGYTTTHMAAHQFACDPYEIAVDVAKFRRVKLTSYANTTLHNTSDTEDHAPESEADAAPESQDEATVPAAVA